MQLLDGQGHTWVFALDAAGLFISGSIGDAYAGEQQAAIWMNGTLFMVEPMPGFGNMIADAINARGFAVGTAVVEGGTWWHEGFRAWIAKPIPEPSTLILVGSAFGFLAWRMRRRNKAA